MRNVVLRFEPDLERTFISLSRQISQAVPSKVVLNEVDALPHLSIYTTNYPEYNLGSVDAKLAHLAKRISSFELNFISKSVELGTVFVNAQKSDALQALHNRVIDELNELREGAYDKAEQRLPGFTEAMRYSLLTYGMWAAKDLYIPHTTIVRPIEIAQCETALRMIPEPVTYTSRVHSVHLVERGPNGTCKRIIQSYPLG